MTFLNFVIAYITIEPRYNYTKFNQKRSKDIREWKTIHNLCRTLIMNKII